MALDKPEETDKPLKIAIDGPAGAGKSTVAREVARRLGISYLDTGAMYRAVTLLLIRNGVDLGNDDAVEDSLRTARLDIRAGEEGTRVYLEGEDVSTAIRSDAVNRMVSQASALSAVRRRMVALQKDIASRSGGIVIEGRDIASRVMPDAGLKFYLDADLSERAYRRWRELLDAGRETPLEDVRAEVANRDRIDSGRRDSPLTVVPGAHVIDTTALTFEEVVGKILQKVRETGQGAGEG